MDLANQLSTRFNEIHSDLEFFTTELKFFERYLTNTQNRLIEKDKSDIQHELENRLNEVKSEAEQLYLDIVDIRTLLSKAVKKNDSGNLKQISRDAEQLIEKFHTVKSKCRNIKASLFDYYYEVNMIKSS